MAAHPTFPLLLRSPRRRRHHCRLRRSSCPPSRRSPANRSSPVRPRHPLGRSSRRCFPIALKRWWCLPWPRFRRYRLPRRARTHPPKAFRYRHPPTLLPSRQRAPHPRPVILAARAPKLPFATPRQRSRYHDGRERRPPSGTRHVGTSVLEQVRGADGTRNALDPASSVPRAPTWRFRGRDRPGWARHGVLFGSRAKGTMSLTLTALDWGGGQHITSITSALVGWQRCA